MIKHIFTLYPPFPSSLLGLKNKIKHYFIRTNIDFDPIETQLPCKNPLFAINAHMYFNYCYLNKPQQIRRERPRANATKIILKKCLIHAHLNLNRLKFEKITKSFGRPPGDFQSKDQFTQNWHQIGSLCVGSVGGNRPSWKLVRENRFGEKVPNHP